MSTGSNDAQEGLVFILQKQIRALEQRTPRRAEDVLSTGCADFDALFPDHGIRRGSLVEWVGEDIASGAGTLALLTAQQLIHQDRPGVFIDGQNRLYPSASSAWSFDFSRVILVTPRSERDTLWAYEQALRCEGVSVVWGSIRHLTSNAFRRLQLAAEASHGIGLLLRPRPALQDPSWADVRLLVKPRPSPSKSPRFRVEVVYSHKQPDRLSVDIEIDSVRGTLCKAADTDETNRLPVVSQLVDPTTYYRQAGA